MWPVVRNEQIRERLKSDAGCAEKFRRTCTTRRVESATARTRSPESDRREVLVKRVEHVDLRAVLSGGVGIRSGNKTRDRIDGNALRGLRKAADGNIRLGEIDETGPIDPNGGVVHRRRQCIGKSSAVDDTLDAKCAIELRAIRAVGHTFD